MNKNEKEKQEQKLELKDCVAIRQGWINTLWLCAILALLPAAVVVTSLVVFQVLIGAVPLTVEAKQAIYCAAFGVWLVGVLLGVIIFHEEFVDYWRRNVVGYTLHLFYGEDGKTIETYLYYGRTNRLGEGGRRRGKYL